MKNNPLWVAAMFMATAGAAAAQDRADVDRTQIIGNRELPKVLYIVPWKKPMPTELQGRAALSVLDEALAPVDRDVHRRQMNYHAQLQVQVQPTPVAAPKPTKNTSGAQP